MSSNCKLFTFERPREFLFERLKKEYTVFLSDFVTGQVIHGMIGSNNAFSRIGGNWKECFHLRDSFDPFKK